MSGTAVALARGMSRFTQSSGTGLIEAVIATAIVATALGTLAALSTVAVRSVMTGRDRTLTAVFAQSKIEALRASPHLLTSSPADALDRDVAGWSERLDPGGRVIGTDPEASGVVFIRRWRVVELPGNVGAFTVAVRVGRCVRESGAGECRVAGDAVVVAAVQSVRVR